MATPETTKRPLIETLPMTLGTPYADDPSMPLNIEIPLQIILPNGQTMFAAVAMGGLPFHGQTQIAERIAASWNAFAGVSTVDIAPPAQQKAPQCLHQISEPAQPGDIRPIVIGGTLCEDGRWWCEALECYVEPEDCNVLNVMHVERVEG